MRAASAAKHPESCDLCARYCYVTAISAELEIRQKGLGREVSGERLAGCGCGTKADEYPQLDR